MALEAPESEKGPESEDSAMEKHKGFMQKARAEISEVFRDMGIASVGLAVAMEFLRYQFPEIADKISSRDAFFALELIFGSGIYTASKMAENMQNKSK